MASTDLGFIKDEIAFYMEKLFQFSYAYVGAIVVVIAGSNADILKNLSNIFESKTEIIISAIIIFLNLVYLIIACSSTYAILKRGYFILSQSDTEGLELYINWERFNRRKGIKKIKNIYWNIDNYYTLFIFVICFVFSVVLFTTVINSSSGGVSIFLWASIVGHIIPILAVIQIFKLVKICRDLIET